MFLLGFAARKIRKAPHYGENQPRVFYILLGNFENSRGRTKKKMNNNNSWLWRSACFCCCRCIALFDFLPDIVGVVLLSLLLSLFCLFLFRWSLSIMIEQYHSSIICSKSVCPSAKLFWQKPKSDSWAWNSTVHNNGWTIGPFFNSHSKSVAN